VTTERIATTKMFRIVAPCSLPGIGTRSATRPTVPRYRASGSSTTKRDPRPGSDSTSIRPSIRRTSSRLM